MTDEPDPKRLMAEAIAKLRRSQARITELESRLEQSQREERRDAIAEPVGIIGMACRLPGCGENLDDLWDLLRTGGDAIGPVPEDRWDPADWRREVPDEPGRFDVDQGGFVTDVAAFDAEHFRIPAREADYLDPQQRLLLETVWHACEDAGIAPSKLRGQHVGVFVGLSTVDYAYEMVEHLPIEDVTPAAGPGTAHSTAAGRISYLFGLLGPSLCVDTACSSSLVALHLAVRSLQAGECDLAFVAGANALLSPYTTLVFDRAGMLAPDGRCKGFDERADGYGRSEGAACLLLERHSDASRASRRTRALVRGSAVAQDGPSAGLTVPSRGAQERVIRAALRDADLQPDDIDAIEAHGTGTALGDPIEAAALGDVFGSGRARSLFVASIKSNMGHLEAAAGAAGVLRAVLQLQNRTLAPQVHFEQPSPHVPWRDLPLVIPTAPTPWPGRTRRMGVSSFGFSGTNAHVVLESVPVGEAQAEGPATFVLSARTAPLLADLARRWQDWLEQHPRIAVRAVAAASHRRERYELTACTHTDDRVELVQWLQSVRDGAIPIEPSTAPEHLPGLEVPGSEAPGPEAPGTGVDGPPHPFARRHHWFPQGVRHTPDGVGRPRLWQQVWSPVTGGEPAGKPVRTELVASHPAPDPTDLFALLEAIRSGQRSLRLRVPAGNGHDHLTALARVLRLEEPGLDLQIVRGVAASHPLPGVEDLPGGEDDIWQLDGGSVLVPRLRPLTLPEGDWKPDPSGHYVVTGGQGVLGGHVVCWLTDRGARSVETLGRSPAKPWSELPSGVDCHHTQLDLGSRDAVQRWADSVPRIDAVFHLAGVQMDGLARDATPNAYHQIAHGKAFGGRLLHTAVAHRPEFDRFCSFSSAAAVLGNPGQALYAAANGALPAGSRAVRVAFGPWSGAGMAAGQDATRWRRRGVRPLSPKAALRCLGQILSAGVQEALVLDVDWEVLVRSLPDRSAPPLLSGLLATPASHDAGGDGAVADELPALVEALLGRPLRPSDHEHSLAELGLDSLMLVDLRHGLKVRCGVDVPMATLTGGQHTLRELAQFNGDAGRATTDAQREANLLAEIEGLSDAEARRLLDENAPDEPSSDEQTGRGPRG